MRFNPKIPNYWTVLTILFAALTTMHTGVPYVEGKVSIAALLIAWPAMFCALTIGMWMILGMARFAERADIANAFARRAVGMAPLAGIVLMLPGVIRITGMFGFAAPAPCNLLFELSWMHVWVATGMVLGYAVVAGACGAIRALRSSLRTSRVGKALSSPEAERAPATGG